MRTLVSLSVLVLVLAFTRTAEAGDFCGSKEEADAGMKAIEAFAKNKAKAKELEEGTAWLCVELDAIRLRPRIERACLAILDRDGTKSQCATIAAAAGISKLGAHDLFAWVLGRPDDPLAYSGTNGIGVTSTMMLGRMSDPRAAQALREMWSAAIPRAQKNEKRSSAMMNWSMWRQHAAESLGAVGGKDESAFLEEQAKATKDSYVAKACRTAIAAIEKRLASPPPKP